MHFTEHFHKIMTLEEQSLMGKTIREVEKYFGVNLNHCRRQKTTHGILLVFTI